MLSKRWPWASVEYADRSRDAFQRVGNRTTLADAVHQSGETARAKALFVEAEALQAEDEPQRPKLYSIFGFRYCDLLLVDSCATEVRKRAEYALKSVEDHGDLLSIGLDHLSLGRAALALGERDEARAKLDQAVNGLRRSGEQIWVARGLLARAVLFREIEDRTGARRDLDEAMRLFQCDAYLGYARLALAEGERERARGHVAEAKRLVEETGYGCRRPEVEELETQLFD